MCRLFAGSCHEERMRTCGIPPFPTFIFQRGEFLNMQFKKSKTFLAAVLAAAMTCSAILPTAASAAGSRTKDEAYGDDSYAARFMSLYDDVVTNGVENGYMSSTNTVSGGLGIPFHSVEELCVEAPDYGHETTSEALSYLVWAAAMRDNIVNDASKGEVTVKNTKDASTESIGDLAKAWKTMEATMIPDQQGGNFMQKGGQLSATYSDEWGQIEQYPTDMAQGNTAQNPIHQSFCSAYGSDKGLYLMHWLADVDDWYGFGGKNSSKGAQSGVTTSGSRQFTLINTFQRGEQESCWETIPHACTDLHDVGYGLNGNGGMKGFFNTEEKPAEQWSYTNAPDAEDRAIQAVYDANRWGVGDQTVSSKWGGNQSISALAGKMGDETRNNMYDKYYKKIGCQDKWANGGSDNGKHYLMNWYTSWGGALDGSWAWQIGASHCHEFYQNPLAAYALVNDSALNAGMKAQGATEDFEASLSRQMELYLWLMSKDGPIAGGCTNSWNGRYEQYPSGQATFYDMAYLEHPVYADPGSNHWIGNQVWAVQRLAELYYVVKGGNANDPQVGKTGLKLSEALEKILDRWVGWFMDNTILGKANGEKTFSAKYEPYDTTETEFTIPDLSKGITDDGESFSIPSSLIWSGQPNDWKGTYQDNNNLTCTIVGYGDGDLGCVSSLANTLIYYAKAKGVATSDMAAAKTSYENKTTASAASATELAQQSLYLGKQLLDREWNKYRDDIGLGVSDHNTNLKRLWETKLALPDGTRANGENKVLSASRYTGTMPNGDTVKDGVAFVDIRSNYKDTTGEYMSKDANGKTMYDYAKECYDAKGNTDDYYFTLHRFWHAGDIMMALGTMYELYPDMSVNDDDTPSEDLVVTPSDIEITVGESETLKPNQTGCTFDSADSTIASVDADGNVTGVSEGETTIKVSKDGKAVEVKVTVKAATTTDTTATTDVTTDATDSDVTTASTSVSSVSITPGQLLLGDTNLDGSVDVTDAVLLNKKAANVVSFNEQQTLNGDCYDQNGEIDGNDATALLKFLVHILKGLPENSSMNA